MLQPGTEHFLDPMQFRAPQIAHVIEASVNGIEALVDTVESGLEKSDEKPDQRGVKQHRNAD
jgi:hypothetical protein